LGPDLMQKMREQAERFGAQIIDAKADTVDFSHRPFSVISDKKTYTADSIVIATGAQAQWLNIPGEQELIGRGVSSCAVCDAAFFRGKKTFVVGGGDAAMEDALALAKFAESVTILHRRDSFRASKVMQDRIFTNEKIHVVWNAGVQKVIGADVVEKILIEHFDTHVTEEVAADGLFVAIGHKPSTELFAGQLELDAKGYIVTRLALGEPSIKLAQQHIVDKKLQFPTMTTVKGVFAAGDVVDFLYRQAMTAGGFGVMAALDAERWLETVKSNE